MIEGPLCGGEGSFLHLLWVPVPFVFTVVAVAVAMVVLGAGVEAGCHTYKSNKKMSKRTRAGGMISIVGAKFLSKKAK